MGNFTSSLQRTLNIVTGALKAIIIAFAAVMLLTVGFLAYCIIGQHPICQEFDSAEETMGNVALPVTLASPDNQWTARVHKEVCGVFAPSNEVVTYLTITKRGQWEDTDEKDAVLLLTDDHAGIPKLHWLDNETLEIGLPHRVNTDKFKKEYKDIHLKYVGSIGSMGSE